MGGRWDIFRELSHPRPVTAEGLFAGADEETRATDVQVPARFNSSAKCGVGQRLVPHFPPTATAISGSGGPGEPLRGPALEVGGGDRDMKALGPSPTPGRFDHAPVPVDRVDAGQHLAPGSWRVGVSAPLAGRRDPMARRGGRPAREPSASASLAVDGQLESQAAQLGARSGPRTPPAGSRPA